MLKRMSKRKTYPQQELADRLKAAMEEADVNLAELSKACDVTIQAVYDWRNTGRIGKHHLLTICRLTKKPIEYFLVGLRGAAVLALGISLGLLAPTSEHNNFYARAAIVRIARLFRNVARSLKAALIVERNCCSALRNVEI